MSILATNVPDSDRRIYARWLKKEIALEASKPPKWQDKDRLDSLRALFAQAVLHPAVTDLATPEAWR